MDNNFAMDKGIITIEFNENKKMVFCISKVDGEIDVQNKKLKLEAFFSKMDF